MGGKRTAVILAALGAGACSVALAASVAGPHASALEEQIAIGTDTAGRNWYLGGFSALASEGKSGKEFWAVTDRGPNDDSDRALPNGAGVYCAAKPGGKVIFLPGFTPQLLKIGVRDDVKVQERIALHDGAHLASGLPNLPGDENAWVQTNAATKSCAPAAKDPFGVDTEGVAVDPRDGSFWLSDEYRPSLLHVAPTGQILSRIVPQGQLATDYANALTAAGGSFDVVPAFPPVVNAFRKNRGFEGVAISPNGKTLYTLLQSPMDNPSSPSSERTKARNSPYVRVFRVDISEPTSPTVTAQWIYLLSRGFASSPPDKISDVQVAGDDVLLVEERDDERPTVVTKLYLADFSAATNLLDPGNPQAHTLAARTTSPTLETTNPVPAFVIAAATTLETDLGALLSSAGFVNSKIEGIAAVPRRGSNPALLVAVNDNDFDLDHTVLPATFGDPNPTQVDIFPQP